MQQHATRIVMLTRLEERGRAKCFRYWPFESDEISVNVVSEESVKFSQSDSCETADKEEEDATTLLIRRVCIVRMGRVQKRVVVYQYEHWMDYQACDARILVDFVVYLQSINDSPLNDSLTNDSPLNDSPLNDSPLNDSLTNDSPLNDSLTNVLSDTLHRMRVDDCIVNDESPVIVHCSAGCGRSGTYCAIDSVIRTMKKQSQCPATHSSSSQSTHKQSRHVNQMIECHFDLIHSCIIQMRGQRTSMVQTFDQYVLCYVCCVEWISRQVINNRDDRASHGIYASNVSNDPNDDG